jgi:hypothetical protein
MKQYMGVEKKIDLGSVKSRGNGEFRKIADAGKLIEHREGKVRIIKINTKAKASNGTEWVQMQAERKINTGTLLNGKLL